MVTLRPYQLEAVDAVRARYVEGDRATLLVMATGTGKTTVFGEIARRTIANSKRVLVLAHRDELIRQAATRMGDMCHVEPGIEKAHEAYAYNTPLCVASVQTLQGRRLESLRPGWFDLVIVDEAHHAVADSYRRVIDHVGGHLLGVTATADRADRRGLAEVFDSIAYEYPIAQAVKDGWLCPIRAKCLPLQMDITQVKTSHGDYQAGDLGDALEPYLKQIAQVMAVECKGRKTVVFLPLVSTAEKMAKELADAGLCAAAVSGQDPIEKRRAKIAAFESGQVKVLCNAMLLTEGWDCPDVDCIVVLRPTKSRSLFTQIIGRGTRLSPGKSHLLLLDFLWLTDRHDLCRPASLLGKEPRVAELMQKAAESGDEYDLMDAAETAEADAAKEREDALAAELAEMRKRKKKLVDPLQFAASIMDAELMDYRPTFSWESKPATENQRRTLEKFGLDGSDVATYGQASALIDACFRRVDAHLATAKQIRCLEKFGFRHVATWPFSEANKMISRMATAAKIGNTKRWRVPAGIDPATYEPPGAKGGDAA